MRRLKSLHIARAILFSGFTLRNPQGPAQVFLAPRDEWLVGDQDKEILLIIRLPGFIRSRYCYNDLA
jgi:hypothetical protein